MSIEQEVEIEFVSSDPNEVHVGNEEKPKDLSINAIDILGLGDRIG